MKPQIEPHELMIFGAITAYEAEIKAENKMIETEYPLKEEDYTPNTKEIAKKCKELYFYEEYLWDAQGLLKDLIALQDKGFISCFFSQSYGELQWKVTKIE